MPAPMVMFAFLLIVFAPCMLAYLAWSLGDTEESDEKYADRGGVLARMGGLPAPLQAALPERPIGGEFEIRSFPKGISQRRILLRDSEGGPRLKIDQVRAAAIELAKLGGFILAHELALATAALVAAGRSLAAAAREAIEAAHNIFARQAWAGSVHPQSVDWSSDEGPPRFEPRQITTAWREESAAA